MSDRRNHRLAPDHVSRRLHRAGWVVVLCAALAPALAPATEISGILLYSCDRGDDPYQCEAHGADNVAWHTAADDIAGAIGVLPSLLPNNLKLPRANPSLDLSHPLKPGKQTFTLVWQPAAGRFPLRLGINLFFNGNALEPGIAAIVPTWAGIALTNFRPNLSATTLSMYLREVENPATVTYSDGNNLVELTALLASPPKAFATVDLMRLNGFGNDGQLDAVGVIELSVTPIVWRRTPSPAGRPVPQPALAPGLTAEAGLTPEQTAGAPARTESVPPQTTPSVRATPTLGSTAATSPTPDATPAGSRTAGTATPATPSSPSAGALQTPTSGTPPPRDDRRGG